MAGPAACMRHRNRRIRSDRPMRHLHVARPAECVEVAGALLPVRAAHALQRDRLRVRMSPDQAARGRALRSVSPGLACNPPAPHV